MLLASRWASSVVFIAGMLIAGCVQPLAVKAYEGPDLTAMDVAVVQTYAPFPDWVVVIRISQSGTEYYKYRLGATDPNLADVLLVPGDYEILLEGRCGTYYPLVARTVFATLLAGHTYKPRTAGCGLRDMASDTFSMWLQDASTGEDVTNSKGTLIPREEDLFRH